MKEMDGNKCVPGEGLGKIFFVLTKACISFSVESASFVEPKCYMKDSKYKNCVSLQIYIMKNHLLCLKICKLWNDMISI